MMNDVVYKDIPEFPGYKAGGDGSIWSCWGRGPRGMVTGEWHQLAQTLNHRGRPTVGMCKGGKGYRKQVCRLVLEAFVGPCPEGMECRHYPDPDPKNNKATNISWSTHAVNEFDKIEHGTILRGDRHPNANMTTAVALDIRRRCDRGESQASVARLHGICFKVVHDVFRRKKWKHLPADEAGDE